MSQEPDSRTTDRSRNLHDRAREIYPGGVSHNVRYVEPYPLSVDRVEGPYLWDADGNRYVDFWMNHHASVLGHTPPSVVERVQAQASNGLHYGAGHEAAIEIAEKVQAFFPSAERFRFCASGTEATMYAVRLARRFTGRDHLLKVEGGWHGGNTDLSFAINPPYTAPDTTGLPPGVREHVHAFELNDQASLTSTLDAVQGDVAAVIIDPRKAGTPPTDAFLDRLVEERDNRGFLLVFDEVVTGFRLAPGSYQARVGVTPDLTTMGKMLGGGLPVGGIAGRADVFEPARPDYTGDGPVLAGGGTFSMNPMTVAAGLAGIEVLESEPVYDHIERLGERLRTGLNDVFAEADVNATTVGIGSLFRSAFAPTGPLDSPTAVATTTDDALYTEFHNRLLDHGFYFLSGHMGNVSYATTDEHVDAFLEAARTVVQRMQRDGLV